MALIFSLSIECGAEEKAAKAVARHFDGLAITLTDGTVHRCGIGFENFNGVREDGTRYGNEGWWVLVCFNDVSSCGIQNEEDRKQMTELGHQLYDRLRSAPPYRFALVGVEVDGFAEFSDLDRGLLDRDHSGLVLEDAIWKKIGSPRVFVPFAPGFHWWPFVRVH